MMGSDKPEQTTVNETGAGADSDTRLTRGGSPSVRYRVIRADGFVCVPEFNSARAAADYARQMWVGQEQDETRSGLGWDIEVVR